MQGNLLTAYLFGTGKFALLEFDVALQDGAQFGKAEFQAMLDANSIGHFAYVAIQTQHPAPSGLFAAKISMAPGYDLQSMPGQGLTGLSQAVLQRIEMEDFKVVSLEDGLNIHFTVYG